MSSFPIDQCMLVFYQLLVVSFLLVS